MANWEKFVRDVINKTILSGKFGDPYDSKGDRAREVQAVYLSSPGNPVILRDRDLFDTIRSVATGLAEMLEPVDPETGLPNTGPTKAGTILFSRSPSWFKAWLGDAIRRHPRLWNISRAIENEWYGLGSGAFRRTYLNKNVVAKIGRIGSYANERELLASLLLREMLPTRASQPVKGIPKKYMNVIVPRPYAMVYEKTPTVDRGVLGESILFSQYVPMRPIDDDDIEYMRRLSRAIGRSGVTRRRGFYDAVETQNLGVLDAPGSPVTRRVLYDLGNETVNPKTPSSMRLHDYISRYLTETVDTPVSSIRVVR